MLDCKRDEPTLRAEESALHCLLADPTLLAATDLDEVMFTSVSRRIMYRSMRELHDKGLKVDVVTVAERSESKHHTPVLNDLRLVVSHAGEPGNFLAYERITVDAYNDDVVRGQARLLLENQSKTEEVLKVLTNLGVQTRWQYSADDAVAKAYRLAQEVADGRSGVKTPFHELNRMMTKNLMPGRLTVIGGRPAMGKTAIATSLALHDSTPFGIFSSEMSVDQLTLRMLSNLTKTPLADLMQAMGSGITFDAAANSFAAANVRINDKPGITIDEIAKQARSWAYNDGVKVILVDYLQRLGKDRSMDRTSNLREQIEGAKELARQLDIHVIMLSQVKRDIEYRDDKRPIMSDFDGASTIESEADHAIMLYRPYVYDAMADPSEAELILCKNRHGPLGTVFASFDGATTTFSESHRDNSPF